MPAPTAHTENSLLTLMEDELGPALLDEPGLRDALPYGLYTVERMLHMSVVAVPAADLEKLETLARWQAWVAALNAVIGQYDISLSGGKKFVRSQKYEQVTARLSRAEAAALRYDETIAALAGAGGVAVVTTIGAGGNPYAWNEYG